MYSLRVLGLFFFFFTLVTGLRGSLSLKLSDSRVYEPQIRFGVGGQGVRGGPSGVTTKSTGSWMGPPQGKWAPRLSPIYIETGLSRTRSSQVVEIECFQKRLVRAANSGYSKKYSAEGMCGSGTGCLAMKSQSLLRGGNVSLSQY